MKEVDSDLCKYEVDEISTIKVRKNISENRIGWLEEDATKIAARYKKKELNMFDLLSGGVKFFQIILDERRPNSK